MPVLLDDIKAIKERYVNNLYAQVRSEQKKDQQYIDDTFDVPEIHDPHHIYRAGLGQRIVDAPAEQIITANPQVFLYPKNPTKASQESALRLSTLINEQWIPILQKQNPNIFKEFIKAQLGRGEAFLRVSHNESYRQGFQNGLPVHFTVPESMVVYASPEENDEGCPEKVIVCYQLSQYQELIPKYPFLAERGLVGKDDLITWWEYYDKDHRYIEVAEQPVTKGGIQSNIYGFVPFVRKLSGFGRRSPSGELANLIVSDIKRSRDLIREECACRSNIASIEALFAHKPAILIAPGLDPEKLREETHFGEYSITHVDATPDQVKLQFLEITPSPDMFRHHSEIVAELNQRHPFIMAGFPWGTSGRQQDITENSAMRRYDSTVENTEYAFSAALGMALRLCASIPNLRPAKVTQKDLETEYNIEVKLKAKDPIKEDRLITLGDRLWNGGKGSISLRKFHIDYQGMTEEESNKEVARMLADQITIYNPDVAAVMGMVAAEESGMEVWLEKASQRRQEMEKQPGLRQPLPATSQERIRGEVETPLGREEAVGRGARKPPERYVRS